LSAEAGERGRYALPRTARITASEEIRTLFRRGKRRKTRHLDVFLASSPAARSRLGLVVPKHRRNSVQRNRLKRRLRELGRTRVLPALDAAGLHLDVMLRARPDAYEATFAQLLEELDRLVEGVCSSGG
jgi:ribonuclease P protein component